LFDTRQESKRMRPPKHWIVCVNIWLITKIKQKTFFMYIS